MKLTVDNLHIILKLNIKKISLNFLYSFLSFNNISLIKTGLIFHKTINIYLENVCCLSGLRFYFIVQNFQHNSLLKLNCFIDICIVDNLLQLKNYKKKYHRFFIIYNLLSVYKNISLHFYIGYNFSFLIYSINLFFIGSHWAEREAFDMFGIFFKSNSDLRRILTDYGFVGFPLQKNFPLYGFKEVIYSEESFSVIYTPLFLPQAPRGFFNLSNRW